LHSSDSSIVFGKNRVEERLAAKALPVIHFILVPLEQPSSCPLTSLFSPPP
jgi:hypothetical protein